MHIPSIKKLKKKIYKNEMEDWFSRSYRKISIYGTWLSLHIPEITPTQITLMSLVFGVMAGIFYATGDYIFGLYGSFLFFLMWYADCIDGEIARFKKMSSIEGHHMDALAGHLGEIAILFGIVFGSFIKTESFWVLGLGFIMLMSMISYDLIVNLRYATYNYYCYHKNKQQEILGRLFFNTAPKNNKKPGLLTGIFFNLSKLMFLFQLSFRNIFIIFMSIFNRMEYVVFFYALIYPPFLIVNIIYQYYGGLKAFFDRTDKYQKTGKVTTFSDS